jgi:hypothetical protein
MMRYSQAYMHGHNAGTEQLGESNPYPHEPERSEWMAGQGMATCLRRPGFQPYFHAIDRSIVVKVNVEANSADDAEERACALARSQVLDFVSNLIVSNLIEEEVTECIPKVVTRPKGD